MGASRAEDMERAKRSRKYAVSYSCSLDGAVAAWHSRHVLAGLACGLVRLVRGSLCLERRCG